jgi:hypothetical protein
VGKGELMYELFKVCIADHQGGGVESYYLIETFTNLADAIKVLWDYQAEVVHDSWTAYELKERIVA